MMQIQGLIMKGLLFNCCQRLSAQKAACASGYLIIVCSTLFSSAQLQANVEVCTDTRAPLERLACFDKLYNTPIYPADVLQQDKPQPATTLTDIIWEQENRRSGDDVGLLSSASIEYVEAEQERVIITVPALAAVGTRPLLSASCSDDITRLQLLLTKPLKAHRLNVELHNGDGKTIAAYPWRVSENGYVLDAGRGIPSIKLLQKLLSVERLYINSDESAVNDIHFDITQLPKKIGALQQACHWTNGVALRD